MAMTIKDIAKIAGVSYSTVSRSLNDSPLVADKTKRHIKKIAEELGFEFNANARSLTTSKKRTIGIIYPEDFEEFGISLYYSSLHSQMRRSLEERDLDLIVSFPHNRVTKKNNIKKLVMGQKVDGLIIANNNLDAATLKFIENTKIPYVFSHHPVKLHIEEVDSICTDHFLGGYLATQHLIKAGRKRIMCMTGGEELEFVQRTEGYKAALFDHNRVFEESLIIEGKQIFHAVQQLVEENLEKIKSVDAIFIHTDLMAWGVIEKLKELRIRVPQDIAIIGYDDIELSEYITPQLTTIHQPRESIAILTCERLCDLIDSGNRKERRNILLEPTLVVRESCGYKK